MKAFLWVVALLAMALPAAAKTNYYPIRITSELGIRSVADIPAKLKERVSFGENSHIKSLEASLGRDKDGYAITRLVYTGEDYERVLADGYQPQAWANSELLVAAFFIQAVEPLFYLRMAKPSKISYVRSLKFNRHTPCELPRDIKCGDFTRDVRFMKNTNEYIVTKLTNTRLWWNDPPALDEDAEPFRYVLHLLAYGDFNGDGIEDLLCFFQCDAMYKSWWEFDIVVLTRYRPNGLLYSIPDMEKPMLKDLRKRKTAGI